MTAALHIFRFLNMTAAISYGDSYGEGAGPA
jgi:hypothetical protein